MDRRILWFVFLDVLLYCCHCQDTIVNPPVNSVQVIGAAGNPPLLLLTCQYVATSTLGAWNIYLTNDPGQAVIAGNIFTALNTCTETNATVLLNEGLYYQCEAGANILSTLSSSLVPVSFNYANTYECQIQTEGTFAFASAYLAVVDNQVLCQSVQSAVGFNGTATCTMAFGGLWPPTLIWSTPTNTLDWGLYSYVNDTDAGLVTYEISIGPFTMDNENSSEYFTCESYLGAPPPGLPQGNPEAIMDTSPITGYTPVTCAAYFDLQYPVTNTTMLFDGINEIPQVLNISDTLVCTAGGNPGPNYQWTTNVSDTQVFPGPVFTVPETMEGTVVTITCTASNTMDFVGSDTEETVDGTVYINSIATTATTIPTTKPETTEPTTTVTTSASTTTYTGTIPTTTLTTATTTKPSTETRSPTTEPTTTTPTTAPTNSEPPGFTFETWMIILLSVVATSAVILVPFGLLKARCCMSKPKQPQPVVYPGSDDSTLVFTRLPQPTLQTSVKGYY